MITRQQLENRQTALRTALAQLEQDAQRLAEAILAQRGAVVENDLMLRVYDSEAAKAALAAAVVAPTDETCEEALAPAKEEEMCEQALAPAKEKKEKAR